jgi:hypothetical protein
MERCDERIQQGPLTLVEMAGDVQKRRDHDGYAAESKITKWRGI